MCQKNTLLYLNIVTEMSREKKILLYLNVGIPEKKKILEESDSTVGIECAFKLLKRENLIFSSVLG